MLPATPDVRFAASLAATFLALACAGSGDSGATVAPSRDSAGVAIVSNKTPLWNAATEWKLSAQPIMEIGAQGSDSLHSFAGLISVARTADGRMVVANRRPYVIRLYGADGKFIRNIGRAGQGPGEYMYLTNAFLLPHDSILVATEVGRSSVLGLDGSVGSTASFEKAPRDFGEFSANPWPRAVFSDGSVLIAVAVSERRRGEQGVLIDSLEFHRYGLDGKRLNSIGVHDEYELFLVGEEYYVRSATPERVWSVTGNKVYTGNGREFEIRVYENDGTLSKVIRLETPAVRLTPDSIAKRKERRLAAATTPEARQRIEKVYSTMNFPDSLPRFDNMVAAADGGIWVKEYNTISATLWYVFNAEGVWLGTMNLPERFELKGIADDLVYGTARDADDVETVRVYRILKSP
jgi:hypothetical protein